MGMTMKREDKVEAEKILKGQGARDHMTPAGRQMCREQGREGFAMTPKEYAERVLGRREVDAQTATARKMQRMGWTDTEGGGYKKITRR